MRLPSVLIPGLQSDHRSWTEQTRYFQDRRQIVIPSGHHSEPSIEAMGAVILPQLPKRFHAVAWSMGGYVLLDLLPKLRGRLASLVLISTSARSEDPESTARRQALIALAEAEGMERTAQRSQDVSCLDPSRVDPEVRDAVLRGSVDLGFDAYRSQQNAVINRANGFANLRLVDMPTLIVTGQEDAVVAPDCSHELHRHIPGSSLVVIDRCGHCPPYEDPDRVNALLDDWFDRHDQRQFA